MEVLGSNSFSLIALELVEDRGIMIINLVIRLTHLTVLIIITTAVAVATILAIIIKHRIDLTEKTVVERDHQVAVKYITILEKRVQ